MHERKEMYSKEENNEKSNLIAQNVNDEIELMSQMGVSLLILQRLKKKNNIMRMQSVRRNEKYESFKNWSTTILWRNKGEIEKNKNKWAALATY